MKLQLMNVVVMAEDYAAVRDWYVGALELDLAEEHTEHYHYAELKREGRFVVGIASAAEMKVEPDERRRAAVVGQLNVDDARAFLTRVKEWGGAVPFGPSFDEHGKFWYGGFADLEGNPWWVVEFPTLFQ